MSRKINLEGELSDEDREYLLARNRTNLVQQLDRNAREQAAKDAASNSISGTGVVEEVIVEEVDTPYDEWKVDELRSECANRNLSTDGLKADLVERLEKDDESA